jgi:hypothetical protein
VKSTYGFCEWKMINSNKQKYSRLHTDTIPKSLVYEENDGKPIYYRGYKKVLEKPETIEGITGSSIMQSLVISRVFTHLVIKIDKNNFAVAGEKTNNGEEKVKQNVN